MFVLLEFAELHGQLFLAGTNLQTKLDPKKRTGLQLTYDKAEKMLLVRWNGKEAIVPLSNVASMVAMTEKSVEVKKDEPYQHRQAQVETPTGHVFAGAGKGQTGQEKRGKAII